MDEQKKYIDAEQLKEKSFSAGLCDAFGNFYGADEIILLSDVAEIPAADVQPVKRGRWIESNPQNSDKCRLIERDQCGNIYIVGFNVSYEDWTQSDNRNYCGRCGAYMR